MKGIRHTGIVVSDFERALYFYRDLLGLKVTKRMKESGDYIEKILGLKNIKVTTIKMSTQDGNLIELLYFVPGQKKAGKRRTINEVGISHLSFTVTDINAEYKRLSKAGVKFISTPQVSPDGYAKVAFCVDYDNVFIELVEVL